jgi:hypothetical protein
MNLNDMPITMDEPATNPHTPTHAVHHTLIDTLLSQFTAHIDMLVETKFNALVQTRNALKLMDDTMEKKIADLVTEAIAEHENSYDHHDSDDIERIAADQARETLSEYAERQEGWVTKDQVNDLITEHVDEELDRIDWEEKVKDVLREML